MPPPWTTRVLPGGSSSNTDAHSSTPSRTPTETPRDKGLSYLSPNDHLEPLPTLARPRVVPSPSKPVISGSRHHSHTRSASNPLPKIFSRKKSSKDPKFDDDDDAQLGDDFVPTLDEQITYAQSNKTKANDDGKVARRCMCCDSKVGVPKDLDKFRCMCCLTINDLKAVEEQSDEDKSRPGLSRADTDPAHPSTRATTIKQPLTVERTRTIIDRCLITYLENRCRRPEAATRTLQSTSPKEDVFGLGGKQIKLRVPPSKDVKTAGLPTDDTLSSTPPDTPVLTEGPFSLGSRNRDLGTFENHADRRIDTPPPEKQISPSNSTHVAAVIRKPVPSQPTRRPPPPPPLSSNTARPSSKRLFHSGNHALNPGDGLLSPRPPPSPGLTAVDHNLRRRHDRVKVIFRPLEDYLVASFGDLNCLNTAFSTARPVPSGRTRSESNISTPPPGLSIDPNSARSDGLSGLDAKTLLLGDIGENGSWWTGRLDRHRAEKTIRRKKVGEGVRRLVSSRSPNINWRELGMWHDAIHSAGSNWRSRVERFLSADSIQSAHNLQGDENALDIDEELSEAREHAVRTLLKITENILKRPTRPIRQPEEARFLIILLSNPSLYPPYAQGLMPIQKRRPSENCLERPTSEVRDGQAQASPKKSPRRDNGHHSGLLKRIFGLLAHLPDNCHRYLIGWFAYLDERHFVRIVDLVASFVTYRISRKSGRPRRKSGIDDGGLIPDLSGGISNTSAQLHSALGLSGSAKKRADDPDAEPDWAGDWQIKAAAKVMSLLFTANNIWHEQPRVTPLPPLDSPTVALSAPSARARRSGQLLPTSSFYNTLLDFQDMIADFKLWETKRDKFAFCQYPLFLSMGTKIKILEYDAHRQMEIKAREAYFDQVLRQRTIEGHFNLRIRRECMVDDSLRQISEAVGAGQEELKKGLRVHFTGEEGVDAGGPRKEWFLMLVRDIFDPNHGMFVYDEESNACYFNPNSFETSDQYYLVGALLGLAIYNSTILDVALPSFVFRKLLAAAPSAATSTPSTSNITGTKGQMTYTLADLAEFRPKLAAGLQQLLDFEGDVETTYCWDFVASTDRYGTVTNVPLKSNGESIPVTNTNRHEFVNAYVRYLLDTAVARQFEPFKRGFFTICAGNALSLFRAEEIELLVRGSDEALNVDSLRAVAVYENWKDAAPPHLPIKSPVESVDVLEWFWDVFRNASSEKQRNLLTFITGTDRIPAVGATSLILKIVAGGDGRGGGGEEERQRFPVARTCFNMLVLWRYDSREQLEQKLWRAVEESEGFGLK